MNTRVKWVIHVINPNSLYSSLIGISFPALSLAFAILKVARIDANVNHNFSDSVSSAGKNLMNTDRCTCNMLSNTTSVS